MEPPSKEELFASFTKTISLLQFTQLFLTSAVGWLSVCDWLSGHPFLQMLCKFSALFLTAGFTFSNVLTMIFSRALRSSEEHKPFAKLSFQTTGLVSVLMVGSYFLAPPALKLTFACVAFVMLFRWWFAPGELLIPKRKKR